MKNYIIRAYVFSLGISFSITNIILFVEASNFSSRTFLFFIFFIASFLVGISIFYKSEQ